MRTPRKFRDRLAVRWGMLWVLVLFGIVGTVLILQAHAAVEYVAVEPENGSVSGTAQAVHDETASNGSSVRFAAGGTAVDPIIAAAGDVACAPNDRNWNGGKGNASGCGAYGTAQKVLALNPVAVLMLGDSQYNGGSLSDFMKSYDPTWGQFKNITYPAIGNHEYGTGGAAGYFNYFGARATPQAPNCRSNCGAYYSFDIGSWHLIALNSECTKVPGGCAAGSPQETWLKADLAAHPNKCTLAYWHQPYWAPGDVLRTDLVLPFIQDLYDANAELILNGHDHNYIRYAPQDPLGKRDTARGVRELVVGSGGAEFSGKGPTNTNVEVFNNNSFGILSLTLHPSSYDWKFIPSTGTFTDSGSTVCH